MLNRTTTALAAAALAWMSGPVCAQQAAPTVVPGPAAVPATLAPAACGDCLSGCGSDRSGGFYGSVGVLFLKSTADTNPAYSRFNRVVDADNGIILSRFTPMTNFDNGVEIAPRLELGWGNGEGAGIRGRFFWYHSADQIQTTDAVDAPFGSTGIVNLSGIFTASPLGVQIASVGTELDPTALVFENRLRLQTWDLEAYWGGKCGCTDLTWSLGVRYLQVSQEYNAFEALITTPPTEDFSPAGFWSQSLRSGHNLQGLGPIIGIEGRRTIADNFRLYALGRAGLLYCEGGQDAFAISNFNPNLGIAPLVQEQHTDRNRLVTTTEVEVGGEYVRQLGGCSELFVRGGLVGQCYFGVGNSSRSVLGGDARESKNNNLGLYGLHMTVGIRY